MKKSIAFFDFDGTITTKDSLAEILKFYKGNFKFYFGLLINMPFIIAYKIGFISNSSAKEKLFRYFFKGVSLSAFQEACNRFSIDVLPKLIRTKALHEIKTLQNLNVEIVIVSASAENWIKKWSDGVGAKLIATKLEVSGEKLTGRISGNNCYGEEKVKRIKEQYDLQDYEKVYCYGDTPGDRPMLDIGDIIFYKPFR